MKPKKFKVQLLAKYVGPLTPRSPNPEEQSLKQLLNVGNNVFPLSNIGVGRITHGISLYEYPLKP